MRNKLENLLEALRGLVSYTKMNFVDRNLTEGKSISEEEVCYKLIYNRVEKDNSNAVS